MTAYVVLKRNGEDWESSGLDVEARSARAAISERAAQIGEGEYVAIPYRSWKPITVKVETKTALRFS